MEDGIAILKVLNAETPCEPAVSLWVYTQKNWKKNLSEISLYLCSIATVIIVATGGSNLGVHQWVSV